MSLSSSQELGMDQLAMASSDVMWPGMDYSFPGERSESSTTASAINLTSEQILIRFLLFFLAEAFFGYAGYYIGASNQNRGFDWTRWDFKNETTTVQAVSGAAEGVLVPSAFYYASVRGIGVPNALLLAAAGCYLGKAADNHEWLPSRWDPERVTSATLGCYNGIQHSLWLVDAVNSVPGFVREARLSQGAETGFYAVVLVSLTLFLYFALADQNPNVSPLEWRLLSDPNNVYWIVRAVGSGKRIPVALGETLVEIQDAVEKSREDNHRNGTSWGQALFERLVVENRWKLWGALFLGQVFPSSANNSFNVGRWNWRTFSTWDALLNGIAFGKHLEGIFQDLGRFLRTGQVESDMGHVMGASVPVYRGKYR